MCKILFVLIVFFLNFNISYAEIYKDFAPYKSLKAIKESYPNGKFEEVKAAWVTDGTGFYKLTGAGLSGTTYLAFIDMTKFYKKLYLSSLDQINVDGISNEEKNKQQSISDYWKSLDDLTKDEKLQLDWVRWAPDEAIPFDRLTSRYGAAEKCGYNEENFRPFCSWVSKGILANLSDNKKYVFFIEYYFTDAERDPDVGIKKSEPEPQKPEPSKNMKKKKM